MNTDKQPLYKALKNKITPGEWEAKQSRGNSLYEHKVVVSGVKTIAEMEADSSDQIPVIKANAEYTALAVNNFYLLAEALKEVTTDLFLQIESKHGVIAASKYHSIIKAKEIINRIS